VQNILIGIVAFLAGVAVMFFGGQGGGDNGGVKPQQMADAVHTVLEANRTVYTQKIINRLSKVEKVIQASEHWEDEKALLLPAQMFSAGSLLVQKKHSGFSYALLSEWPINAQNMPKTEAEKNGLKAIRETGNAFYTDETLGNQNYFTAVYPDKAISPACVDCHNDHKDSPRKDFKLNEIMGGIVIRIPL